MEEFKKQLQRRQQILACALLFTSSALTLSRRFLTTQAAEQFISPSMVYGFQAGLVTALLACGIFLLIRNGMFLKNPEQLKKLYIAETDERTLLIRQKSGSVGMNFTLYGLAVGAAVAANLNVTAFFTLLGATFFVALVRLALKLYYRNKY